MCSCIGLTSAVLFTVWLGDHLSHGRVVWLSVRISTVQVAPLAPPADWEAAHYLGIQDPLPGCSVPLGCRQDHLCGRRSGKDQIEATQERAVWECVVWKWETRLYISPGGSGMKIGWQHRWSIVSPLSVITHVLALSLTDSSGWSEGVEGFKPGGRSLWFHAVLW